MLRYALFSLFLAITPVLATGPTDTKQVCASKLIGVWEGQGGCDGDLTIRADKTFELKGYGPGGDTLSGLWHIEWEGQKPTLFLVDKQPGTFYGIMRLQIGKLDKQNLQITHDKSERLGEYLRSSPKK